MGVVSPRAIRSGFSTLSISVTETCRSVRIRTAAPGGYKLDEGDDPSNIYGKVGWDTQFWPLGPTGFGVDYTKGDNISSEGVEGTSSGLAAVRKIGRYGIDLYSQLRWYELDGTDPDLKNIVVGTFGTKFTF